MTILRREKEQRAILRGHSHFFFHKREERWRKSRDSEERNWVKSSSSQPVPWIKNSLMVPPSSISSRWSQTDRRSCGLLGLFYQCKPFPGKNKPDQTKSCESFDVFMKLATRREAITSSAVDLMLKKTTQNKAACTRPGTIMISSQQDPTWNPFLEDSRNERWQGFRGRAQ